MSYPFIDVSNNNGRIDWARVAGSGVKGAYVKASEGTHFHDPYYSENRNGCHDHGLYFGAYHFARPDQSSASAEADFFLSAAAPKKGDLLPCLDFETSPLSATWAADFANCVHQKIGVYPLLYANASTLGMLGQNTTLQKCPIWIASWSTTKPQVPHGWNKIALWQYSGNGHCPGVSGACDRDTAYEILRYGSVSYHWEIRDEHGTTFATTKHPVRWALRHPRSFRRRPRVAFIRKQA